MMGFELMHARISDTRDRIRLCFFRVKKKRFRYYHPLYGPIASRTTPLVHSMYLCYFVYDVCTKGSVNRVQPKADFPTFVSIYIYIYIPVEPECFEPRILNSFSSNLGKGTSKDKPLQTEQTTSIHQLSGYPVFRIDQSSFRNRKKKKERKKEINENTIPPLLSFRHPRTDTSHPHHFSPVQYPDYSKCPPFLFLLFLFSPPPSMATAMKQRR